MLMAKALQIKGLVDVEENQKEQDSEILPIEYHKKTQIYYKKEDILVTNVEHEPEEELTESFEALNSFSECVAKQIRPGSITLSGDFKQNMTRLIEWNGGNWSCSICGKIANRKRNLERHTQTHMEGIAFPCSLCGKEFR